MTAGQRVSAILATSLFAGLALGLWWALLVVAAAGALLTVCDVQGARRVAAAAAAALLVGAAIATVAAPRFAPRWLTTFALDRPLANLLGGLAAVLVVLWLATGLSGDRSERAQFAPVERLPRVHPSTHVVRRVSVGLGVAAVGLLLRSVWLPAALDSGVLVVLANLEQGLGYARGLPEDIAVAPVAPSLLLISGLGAWGLAAAALASTASVGAWLGDRRGRGALLGAAGIALLPSTWAQPLAVVVTAALVAAAAAMLLSSTRSPVGAAVGAGVLVAVAALADPTAVAAGPLLALWIWLDRSRGRAQVLALLTPVAVGAVATVPGVLRLDVDLSTWWRAGGPLGEHAGWLVLVDLLMGAGLIAAHHPGRDSIARLAPLAAVVVAAQFGREGSVGWAWAGGLLLTAVLWSHPPRAPENYRNQSGASSSTRSSSVTSRYHMSAQSLQR